MRCQRYWATSPIACRALAPRFSAERPTARWYAAWRSAPQQPQGSIAGVNDQRGFSARRLEIDNAAAWQSWVRGHESSRIESLSRLASAVKELTARAVADSANARLLIHQLLPTLGRCNELTFETPAETLAYTIWHLTDRYGRVLQVLDALFTAGHLPLRTKRMSVLEIGAGPLPAVYATTDFFSDLKAWVATLGDGGVDICPVTEPMSLDRGRAWSFLVHRLSEALIGLGDRVRPRPFDLTYSEFESFSVTEEHRAGIEQEARRLMNEADSWDETLDWPDARDQALQAHHYPPGAIDLIVMCNFLTHSDMTSQFAEEITLLADSLTPGGVLLALGSASPGYDAIFEELHRLVTRGGRTKPISISDGPIQPHSGLRVRSVIEEQIIDCLRQCERAAPSAFNEVRTQLPRDVRVPGSEPLSFADFRVSAFKNEGVRPRGRPRPAASPKE